MSHESLSETQQEAANAVNTPAVKNQAIFSLDHLLRLFLSWYEGEMETDRHTSSQTGRQKGRKAGRQMDRQYDRQTDRQTER